MPQDADRLEQPQGAKRVGVGGVLRRLEAHLHMALGREIVDLVGLRLLHDADEVGRIGQIAIMHEKARLFFVRIDIEMVDPRGIERRRASLDAVDDIALVEQKSAR